jgi:hypothetical protein
MFRKTVSALVILALALSPAQGASLTNVQGTVAVSTANGFVQVSEGTIVPPRAVVRTGESSGANIVYDNGCYVSMGARQQLAVLDAPPPFCGAGPIDFPNLFGDLSAGEIFTYVAVVAGAIGIIIAASINTKSRSTNGL